MGKNQYVSKHVRVTAEHGFPEPLENQFIVRLIKSRGGNVMECENSEGNTVLCLLPAKFSKVVWAQRGDFLIAEPSALEGSQGAGKLSATIVHILFPEQVKHLRSLPCWPSAFDAIPRDETRQTGEAQKVEHSAAAGVKSSDQDTCNEHDEQSGSDHDDLFQNTNRLQYDSYEDSEEGEEDGEDGEDI